MYHCPRFSTKIKTVIYEKEFYYNNLLINNLHC